MACAAMRIAAGEGCPEKNNGILKPIVKV